MQDGRDDSFDKIEKEIMKIEEEKEPVYHRIAYK
jgi:hypothetical protein